MNTADQLPHYLLRYLHQRGQVTVPGLGRLKQTRIAASLDVAARCVMPPAEQLIFQTNSTELTQHEREYLIRKMGVEDGDLENGIAQVSQQIQDKLSKEKKLEWIGVGSFVVDEHGAINFNAKSPSLELFKSIPYVHVIREYTQHEIRVGDEQRLNTEMESFFEEQRMENKEKQWKKAAVVLWVLAAGILLARFTMGSFSLTEGRYASFSAQEPRTTTYQER